MRAKHPLYVDRAWFLGQNALLRNEIGWPSCIKTAPMPRSLASVSIMNCLLKSGMVSTGAVLKADFNNSKASWACGVHRKVTPFLSSCVRGVLTLLTSDPYATLFCRNAKIWL